MKAKTNDEIVNDILKVCADDPAQIWELSMLIRLSIDDEEGEEDIDDQRIVIERIIKEEELLMKYEAGWSANSKTHKIMNTGGYINYIAKADRRAKLKEAGVDAKYKFNIFVLKTKWLPYVVSGGALIVSILAFLQSGGWICLFKA